MVGPGADLTQGQRSRSGPVSGAGPARGPGWGADGDHSGAEGPWPEALGWMRLTAGLGNGRSHGGGGRGNRPTVQRGPGPVARSAGSPCRHRPARPGPRPGCRLRSSDHSGRRAVRALLLTPDPGDRKPSGSRTGSGGRQSLGCVLHAGHLADGTGHLLPAGGRCTGLRSHPRSPFRSPARRPVDASPGRGEGQRGRSRAGSAGRRSRPRLSGRRHGGVPPVVRAEPRHVLGSHRLRPLGPAYRRSGCARRRVRRPPVPRGAVTR